MAWAGIVARTELMENSEAYKIAIIKKLKDHLGGKLVDRRFVLKCILKN
jgi:hypothetical protein